MDSEEQIQSHLLSVWRESKKFFSMHGKEGMLFLTNKHMMFVTKTEAMMKWWQATSQRQILNQMKSKDVMIRHDGYKEDDLKQDLENKKNLEIPLSSISKIYHEEKSWGSVLLVEYLVEKGKKEKFQFSIVRDWVKYPVKDPTRYLRVDWEPFAQYIKERQNIT